MANDDVAAKPGSAEELQYVQQIYQNQFTIVSNSINMLLQELKELNSAQKTLENMDIIGGRGTLANIGADCFLPSKVQSADAAIMAVGGGYLVEKSIDSSKARISELVKRRTESLNKLMKNRKELEGALIELSYRLENMR